MSKNILWILYPHFMPLSSCFSGRDVIRQANIASDNTPDYLFFIEVKR